MKYILIYMFMLTWMYIIYHNIFNQNNINAEPLHILYNGNNKYIMIDIVDIIDNKLIKTLTSKLEYLNEPINLYDYPLLVIPYDYIEYITFNKMITGVFHKSCGQFKLVPFKTIIDPGTIKGDIIKNNIIYFGDEIKPLYLKKFYSYNILDYDNNNMIDYITIPIFLLFEYPESKLSYKVELLKI